MLTIIRYIGDLELEIERLENAVASESKGIANDSSLGENINQELLNGQSISPAAESTPNQDHHSKQVAHGGGIRYGALHLKCAHLCYSDLHDHEALCVIFSQTQDGASMTQVSSKIYQKPLGL